MSINIYGDQKVVVGECGVDISSQRADDLDNLSLSYARGLKGGKTRALDLACGLGAQALRIKDCGVDEVFAVDKYINPKLPSCVFFIKSDMVYLPFKDNIFNMIVFQRSIHYLPYLQAMKCLQLLKDKIMSGGKIFISASGINSELGNDYDGSSLPIEKRFHYLSSEMSNKHNIVKKVCLYSISDLTKMVVDVGFNLDRIYSSKFGNIKAVLRKNEKKY